MTKRLLILGGSHFQMPLIQRAKARGLHVITCDYLPDNPGHKLADEYHNVSTTDPEGVLALARRIGIDAVASMSSDPAMPTLAYVAEALGLPGPPLKAIRTLTEKDAFRWLLADIGLPTPRHWVVDGAAERAADRLAAALPPDVFRLVVKPVDSSGSRGVSVIPAHGEALAPALTRSLAHSRSKRAIVEEYVEGEQIHGDGFLDRGRLIHHYLGDHAFFTKSGTSVPMWTVWPTRHGETTLRELVRQVEAVAQAAGFLEGAVNIEARVTPTGGVCLIEIGPRNGGNHIPILHRRLTGFDFVGKVLDGALGIRPAFRAESAHRRDAGAVYILHAERDGTYAGLEVSDEIASRLVLLDEFKQAGEPVALYAGSNTSIGVALMQFRNREEGSRLLADMPRHLALRLR